MDVCPTPRNFYYMTFSPSQSVKYVTNEPRMGKNSPIISVAGKTTMEPFNVKAI